MTTPSPARTHATTIDPSTLPALIAGHRSALVFLGSTEPEAGRTAQPGDLVYLDAGQVCAGARVVRVETYRDLNAHELRLLRETHGSRTIGDGSVWSSRPDARFAAVVWLGEVRPVEDRLAVPCELIGSRETWRTLAPAAPARRAA